MTQFTGTREAILARMLEIDIEMHKLTTEELKLHEILRSNNISSIGSAVANSSATRENDTISDQVVIVSTQLTSRLRQNAKINRAKRRKHSSSLKQSPSKRRKSASRSAVDDEITTRYTHRKTKMPVIRWKKTLRLKQTGNRREEDLEEEKDLDETTEQRTLTSFASKEADVSSVLDASEDATIRKSESNASEDAMIQKPESNVPEDATIQKPESNATIDRDRRVQETATETDGKADCDVVDESSSKPTTYLDKSADNRTENSTGREHAERSDIDISESSKAARTNAQPASALMRVTPESLSIYSDDSTWDFLVKKIDGE